MPEASILIATARYSIRNDLTSFVTIPKAVSRTEVDMRIRKNVKRLTAAEKTTFCNAVVALKAKPSVLHPSNPKLTRYDDYPETHMAAMMANPGWAHHGPAFFPWHRELLLQFENDLVAIDPSVTIPYWDWTDTTPATATTRTSIPRQPTAPKSH